VSRADSLGFHILKVQDIKQSANQIIFMYFFILRFGKRYILYAVKHGAATTRQVGYELMRRKFRQ
jgi:hypothetical protein